LKGTDIFSASAGLSDISHPAMLITDSLRAFLQGAGALDGGDFIPVDDGSGYYLSDHAVDAALSGKLVAR
jgi:hypothetical protein